MHEEAKEAKISWNSWSGERVCFRAGDDPTSVVVVVVVVVVLVLLLVVVAAVEAVEAGATPPQRERVVGAKRCMRRTCLDAN